MVSKKIFEFYCECKVIRNEVLIQKVGEKGKLRKIVLNKICTYPEGIRPPPQGDQLKQTTLEDCFKKKPQITYSHDIQPISIKGEICIYQNDELLHQFSLDNFRVEKIIKQLPMKMTLQLDNQFLVMINDVPDEILKMFRDQLEDLVQKSNSLKNKKFGKEEKQQNEVISNMPPLQQQNITYNQQRQPCKRSDIFKEQLLQKKIKLITPSKKILSMESSGPLKIKSVLKKTVLPASLIIKIFEYNDLKSLLPLRVLNKDFHFVINQKIKFINLSKYNEVPCFVIQNFMLKLCNLEMIHFGPIRNISSIQLKELQFNKMARVKFVNMGMIQNLNERFALGFLSSTPNVEKLVISYERGFTNDTVQYIANHLNMLQYLKIQSRDPKFYNEQISVKLYYKLLMKNISYLKIPQITIDCFVLAADSQNQNNQSSKITQLKIGAIRISKSRQDGTKIFRSFIKQSKPLETLKIGSIQSLEGYTIPSTCIVNEKLWLRLEQLTYLSIGSMMDDKMCSDISKGVPNLKKLKVRSKQVTDTGLGTLFSKFKLEMIDIQGCGVSGICFTFLYDHAQTLLFPRIDVKVTFDQHKRDCLEDLLSHKGYEFYITNSKNFKL